MEHFDFLRQPTIPPENLGLGALILLGLLLGLLHQVRIGVDVVTLLVEHVKSEFAATGHSVRKLGAAIANHTPQTDLRTDASPGSNRTLEFLDSHAKQEFNQRSARRRHSYHRAKNFVYLRVRHRLSDSDGRTQSTITRDKDK